jgi:uncharacterized protein YceH (UPF0502 family)
MSETETAEQAEPRRWCPLEARDRRVLGVLVEKSKTTPEAYPLSLNALRTGCNQKNNRYPLMEIELEDVEESLDRLRGLGAVAEMQGGGRVPRFRHLLYEWLGVDKAELAVMAELLLRGAQTEGELRGRVSRMEPLPDLNALRPILDSLKKKGLVVSLTPAGRGHVVTHALYLDREMEKLEREYRAQSHASDAHDDVDSSPAAETARPSVVQASGSTVEPAAARENSRDDRAAEEVAELRRQLEALKTEVATIRKDLDDLWSNFR